MQHLTKFKKHIIYSGIYLFLSIITLFILGNTHITPSKPFAGSLPQLEHMKARVEKIEVGATELNSVKNVFQLATVKILDGKESRQTLIPRGNDKPESFWLPKELQ